MPDSHIDQQSEFIIDLTQRFDVRDLNSNEIIHLDALDRLTKKIETQLQRLGPPGKSDRSSGHIFDRHLETITIQGGRGSGKTTFIRNFLNWLENSQNAPVDRLKMVGQDVVTLGVIDPTLIERKENMFILVLNAIKKRVERVRDASSASRYGLQADDKYEEWRDALRSLADGLSVLDDIGPSRRHGEAWDDANYVMSKGLQQAEGSVGLERAFHTFIEKSLAYIDPERKAFVLAIDDVDTDFSRGWPVLEMLRRYLTSPRLLIVVLGDIELYSILVRDAIWKNFNSAYLANDPAASKEAGASRRVADMVDHLESQFLLKVLPPVDRIDLPTLSRIVESGDRNAKIEYLEPIEDGSDKIVSVSKPLLEFLNTAGERLFGHETSAGQRMVAELIVSLPVRSALQVLKIFADHIGGQVPISRFADDLSGAFIEVLTRFGVSRADLTSVRERQVMVQMAKFLARNDRWLDYADFAPRHRDESENFALLTLSAKILEVQRQNFGLCLDFAVRIALPQVMLKRGLFRGMDTSAWVKYLHVDLDEDPSAMIKRAMIVLNPTIFETAGRPSPSRKKQGIVLNGVVGLRRTVHPADVYAMYGGYLHTKAPTKSTSVNGTLLSEDLENKADRKNKHPSLYLLEYWDRIRNLKFYYKYPVLSGTWYLDVEDLPVLLSKSGIIRLVATFPAVSFTNEQGYTGTRYSVYGLFGVIASLALSSNSQSEKLIDHLVALSEIDTLHTPFAQEFAAFSSDSKEAEADVGSEDEEDDIQDDEAIKAGTIYQGDALLDALTKWMQDSEEYSISVSPQFMSALMERIFSAVGGVTSTVREEEIYLGEVMHRSVLATLNALILEAARFSSIDKSNMDIRNSKKSSNVFLQNLKAFKAISDSGSSEFKNSYHCRFADFMLRCPLWAPFLRPDGDSRLDADKSITQLLEYTGYDRKICEVRFKPAKMAEGDDNYAQFNGLYDVLNAIPCYGVVGKLSEVKESDGAE